MKNNIVEFLRQKDFKFIEEIGQGGTGRTVLLKDEIIGEYFVCKKYSPFNDADKEKYFKNFLDEIKNLHTIYHKNIVRVFNYYLYPERLTGYILMEYIHGTQIDDFISKNPDRLNDIFVQVIDGFTYLEEFEILHRDIRPENLLVSSDKILKIIDFGFSKLTVFEDDFDKSISLNWRFPIPNEFKSKIYDFKTEIYFIGKLFEEIISNHSLENFAYSDILQEMIRADYDSRVKSFFEISRRILTSKSDWFEFSEGEKGIYKRFASGIMEIISRRSDKAEYNSKLDDIIKELENIYQNSILEDVVQNNAKLIRCFIKGVFSYSKKPEMSVANLRDFIGFIKSVSDDKKKVIINNLWGRFDSVPVYDESNDLPF